MSSVVDIHKKNGVRQEFDVYIGRRIQYHKEFVKDSKWANRSPILEAYENKIRYNPELWDALEELKGKRLGCWCITTTELEPVQCHGQILMKLIKEKEMQYCHFCKANTGRRDVYFHKAIWNICTKCDSITSISYRE